MKHKILITGSSGFVGSHLVQILLAQQQDLVCPQRSHREIAGCACPTVGDIDSNTDWSVALEDVHTVIHCAARVHVMNETADSPLTAFRQVNVEGTLALARQAAAAGVRQFIYISSVKVNGEMTPMGEAFNEASPCFPEDAYGISKREAELALWELAETTGMAMTIIRPPLIYGSGVGANFQTMLRWVHRQWPLPLASISNQRSLLFVKNLCHFITRCIQNPRAYQEVFLLSDGEDLSTSQLLRACARALHVAPRLLPSPAWCLRLIARLIGKKSIADRLCLSLKIDSSKARQRLDWSPPYTVQQGLDETAHAFLLSKSNSLI